MLAGRHVTARGLVGPIIRTETTPRYRAFFEALATGNEGTDEWRASRAGLVALRLLDVWRAGGWTDSGFAYERRAVESALAAAPEGLPECRLLATIVARVAESRHGRVAAPLVPPLFAYARALELRSAWAMATAVYAVIWEAYGVEDPIGFVDDEVAASVAQYLGACYRMLGDPLRSSEAYVAAGQLASARGDAVGVLRARLGQAKLCAARGNLPVAERQLQAIIADAADPMVSEVRAHAWHDLAEVAYRRGNSLDAINHAYEAWVATADAVERERVLTTLATLLLSAGHVDVAREANSLLAETATEPFVRWAARINLIEISAIERREIDFTRQRRALAEVDLPPALAGEYHFYVGLGHRAFDQPALAVASFDRAVAMAERHGLAELLLRAEAARLAEPRELVPREAGVPHTRPAGVARVAAAVHSARLLAVGTGV
jgi:tetratricopeptide (TPR) repeat protein